NNLKALRTWLLLALAAPAFAQVEWPKPSPKLHEIEFLIGAWKCDFQIEPGPMGPAGVDHGTVTIKRDLDGFYLSGVFFIAASKQRPKWTTHLYLGWDEAAKQFVYFGVDNWGGWF